MLHLGVKTCITDVFQAIQRSSQARVELAPGNQGIWAKDLEQAQHWIGFLQEALSLPRLLVAVSSATTEGDQLKVRFFESKLSLLRDCKNRGISTVFEELEKGTSEATLED